MSVSLDSQLSPFERTMMDAPQVGRTRLVRDYSTDSMYSSPRQRPAPYRDQWSSPQQVDRSDSIDMNVRSASPGETEDLRKLDFGLDTVHERHSYEASVSTEPTSVAGSSSSRSRLADFFGPEVFQIVLHNPTTAHRLKKFAETRLCGENLEFLEKVDDYHHSLNQVTKTIFDIHRSFISINAPSQVNLPEDVLLQINKNLKHMLAKTVPSMESVFLSAQNDVQSLVASDVYPRFVRHQMTASAARALATNKNKYAGLGDCFCLTDPNKADNPIVYASDGFVKVTGHARNEIIPRNCRFLQTRQTDRESVSRIKKSLENPAEHVELLLNQRKNGEPFWNLLYTAPLYDSTGKLVFFIGGQINVSTTIHSSSDILQILSHDDDDDEDSESKDPSPRRPLMRQSFFSSFRSKKITPSRTPGMENDLLNDLNNMSFHQQKEAFYTAYSKYLVINAETLLISFYSAGIVTLLHSIRTPTSQVAGQDIFKFLGQHANGNLPREYKTRVKTALKSGSAISLNLVLCTRRIMGFEGFVTHWTPVKDDVNVVRFVVLTFGSPEEGKRR